MAELIQLEVQKLPALLVVGREIIVRHEDTTAERNPIPAFWGKCFEENAFAPLEAQAEHIHSPDYVGIMCEWGNMDGDFSYVVGMLMKPGASVPEGYACKEIEPCSAAVSWIRGENEMDACAAAHALAEQALKERGLPHMDMHWCMELYNCPRWTTPDEQGRVVLDYYIPLDK